MVGWGLSGGAACTRSTPRVAADGGPAEPVWRFNLLPLSAVGQLPATSSLSPPVALDAPELTALCLHEPQCEGMETHATSTRLFLHCNEPEEPDHLWKSGKSWNASELAARRHSMWSGDVVDAILLD